MFPLYLHRAGSRTPLAEVFSDRPDTGCPVDAISLPCLFLSPEVLRPWCQRNMVVFNCCCCAARLFSPPLLLSNDRLAVFAVVVCLLFVMIVVEVPGASAFNLTCYSCNTSDPGNVCYNNVSEAPTERCKDDNPSMQCSVYREDVAGLFTYIIRGCNSSCVQKCGAWGEVVDVDKCSSCCDTDFCNVDDAASTPWTAATTWWRLWGFGGAASVSMVVVGLVT